LDDEVLGAFIVAVEMKIATAPILF